MKANKLVGVRVSFENIETANYSPPIFGDGPTKYAHINVYPVTREREYAGPDEWTCPHPWNDHAGWCDGVHLRAQTDNARLLDNPPSHAMYGFQPEWKGRDAGIHELERGVKALRKIVGAMERMAKDDGDHRSFGQYVLRFAKAIGASRMIVKNRKGNWIDWDLKDGAATIDLRISDWVEHCKAPADGQSV